MPELPAALYELLHTADPGAWEQFLRSYSGLILHAIRRMGGDDDVVMDRYVFVLDALRHDDCRRLQAFASQGRGKFTTWLVAVVRRLCVDEHRARYGRPQGAAESPWALQRRNLADLLSDDMALEQLQTSGVAPDTALLLAELSAALELALNRLDPSDRLVLRLRFEDDLPVPEIARLLGDRSPFRLYRRIEKLLSGLRSDLESRGVRGLAS